MSATRESAVRLFAPDHPALAHTVAARLVKEIQAKSEQVAQGYPADWADYRQRVGELKGLQRAIEICQEIDKEMRE